MVGSVLDVNFDAWPADNVAAAAFSGGVQVASHGDVSHVFELASVTKLLAAYGFLIAIEEGVFDLDSPVAGSTVRHLLAHASGVGFKKGDPLRPPETRRVYSSYGFELLADAVAKEAEMPFAQYVDEAVFVPLGMSSTVLWGSAGHEARSCVSDLSNFVQELLNPTLIDQRTLDVASSVHFPELSGVVPGFGMQRPCPWGLGFEIRGVKDPHWLGAQMPEKVVGHFGQSGTYVWVAPEKGVGMVVLTDRPFGNWAKPLWSETNEAVFKALVEL